METANRAVLERRAYWQEHVAQWQASGLTQVTYCRQHGVNLTQFGYWKKRLLPQSPKKAAPRFIAVQLASTSATLAVVLNEWLRVEVQPGFDPATLRAVIQALSQDVPA